MVRHAYLALGASALALCCIQPTFAAETGGGSGGGGAPKDGAAPQSGPDARDKGGDPENRDTQLADAKAADDVAAAADDGGVAAAAKGPADVKFRKPGKGEIAVSVPVTVHTVIDGETVVVPAGVEFPMVKAEGEKLKARYATRRAG